MDNLLTELHVPRLLGGVHVWRLSWLAVPLFLCTMEERMH